MRALVLALLILVVPLAANASPSLSVTVTCFDTVPGTIAAPTACHFDATASTDSDPDVRPMHDWRWEWSWPGLSGTFAADGRPKNREVGRRAFVWRDFRSAGTYAWSVVVHTPSGATASTTGSITVQAPLTGYDAATEIDCVSSSGTFTGCPASAQQITSSDYDATIQKTAGKATLYRCGETFTLGTSVSGLSDASADATWVGTFSADGVMPGNCKATIDAPTVDDMHGPGTSIDGFRFVDLIYDGNGLGSIWHNRGSSDTEEDTMQLGVEYLEVGTCSSAAQGATSLYIFWAFIDSYCQVTENNYGTTGWPWFHANFEDVGFLNSTLRKGAGAQGLGMRLQGPVKVYFGHNLFDAEDSTYEMLISMRGPLRPGHGPAIFADNVIYDAQDEGFRPFHMCPEHSCGADGTEEVPHDYIWEGNLYTGDAKPGHIIGLFWGQGDDITVAENIINLRGMISGGGTTTICAQSDTIAAYVEDRWSCINNTILGSAAQGAGDITLCQTVGLGAAGTNSICRNNLIWESTKTSGNSTGASAGWTYSDNELLYGSANCPLAGNDGSCGGFTAPSETWPATEAKIRASGGGRASVVDTGFVWPDNAPDRIQYVDHFSGCIDTSFGGPDDLPDVGAHEYGAIVCSILGAAPSRGVGGFGWSTSDSRGTP